MYSTLALLVVILGITLCAAQTSTCGPALIATGSGLRAEYYSGNNFQALKAIRYDPNINYNFGSSAPAGLYFFGSDYFSIRWTGELVAKYTGVYTFYLTADDKAKLYIDNNLVIDSHMATGAVTGTYSMVEGSSHSFKLEYSENSGNAVAILEWSTACLPREVIPTSQFIPTPIKLSD